MEDQTNSLPEYNMSNSDLLRTKYYQTRDEEASWPTFDWTSTHYWRKTDGSR